MSGERLSIEQIRNQNRASILRDGKTFYLENVMDMISPIGQIYDRRGNAIPEPGIAYTTLPMAQENFVIALLREGGIQVATSTITQVDMGNEVGLQQGIVVQDAYRQAGIAAGLFELGEWISIQMARVNSLSYINLVITDRSRELGNRQSSMAETMAKVHGYSKVGRGAWVKRE